jgi:hypothetical protein
VAFNDLQISATAGGLRKYMADSFLVST